MLYGGCTVRSVYGRLVCTSPTVSVQFGTVYSSRRDKVQRYTKRSRHTCSSLLHYSRTLSLVVVDLRWSSCTASGLVYNIYNIAARLYTAGMARLVNIRCGLLLQAGHVRAVTNTKDLAVLGLWLPTARTCPWSSWPLCSSGPCSSGPCTGRSVYCPCTSVPTVLTYLMLYTGYRKVYPWVTLRDGHTAIHYVAMSRPLMEAHL